MIGESLDIFVHYQRDLPKSIVSKSDMTQPMQKVIIKTEITVALPLSIVGDPLNGIWEYYVVIGLVDLSNPVLMYSSVFDCIQCNKRDVEGIIELQHKNSKL